LQGTKYIPNATVPLPKPRSFTLDSGSCRLLPCVKALPNNTKSESSFALSEYALFQGLCRCPLQSRLEASESSRADMRLASADVGPWESRMVLLLQSQPLIGIIQDMPATTLLSFHAIVHLHFRPRSLGESLGDLRNEMQSYDAENESQAQEKNDHRINLQTRTFIGV